MKTEKVGGEVIVAKIQAFSTCRGLVCCTHSHVTISSFLYMMLWRKELITCCEVRRKEYSLTLLLFSNV